MKTFKQYFTEETHPPADNWEELLADNEMLSTGVRLLRKIEKLGGEALIVGGSVRDIILGKPIKDVDIATNVPLEKIKQNFKWNDIGGSGQFGITMVHYGGHEFEVANYREEEGTSDHRRPDKVTAINSFEGDSARRDITINSMGINSKGEIVDYQGGLEDLKNGIIRAVGKPHSRFTEDALRILRVARFASKYGFDIEDKTAGAMKDLAHLVDEISVERVREELVKSASGGNHLAAYIENLDASGQLERILPELKSLQGKKQNPEHHPEGDAYEHTLAALRHTRSNNPATNLAILFHDLGKGTVEVGTKNGQPTYYGHDAASAEVAKEIGRRLKFPNAITDAIVFAAANHMRGHNIDKMNKKKITQLVTDPFWPILKDVMYSDELSRGDIGKGGIDEFEQKIAYVENIANEVSAGAGQEGVRLSIKEKIDGNKVMAWTGLKPGREMGQILKATQDWLYENMDASDKEIKDFVMSKYAEAKSKEPADLEDVYESILREQHEQKTL